MMFYEGEYVDPALGKITVLLSEDEHERRNFSIAGQFKRGPFKGKFYTKAAYKIARSIKTVADSGRSISAPPTALQ